MDGRNICRKLILTEKEKVVAFSDYPCLDPSFEDDYSSEVVTLLEAQIKKLLKLGYRLVPPLTQKTEIFNPDTDVFNMAGAYEAGKKDQLTHDLKTIQNKTIGRE